MAAIALPQTAVQWSQSGFDAEHSFLRRRSGRISDRDRYNLGRDLTPGEH
jgi:hypothetical protein